MTPHHTALFETCFYSTNEVPQFWGGVKLIQVVLSQEGHRGIIENKMYSLVILPPTTRILRRIYPHWGCESSVFHNGQTISPSVPCSIHEWFPVPATLWDKLAEEVSTQRNRYSGWVQTWFYKYICSVYFCFFAVLSTSAPYGWSILCLGEMIPHYAFMLLSSNTTHEKITRFA